MLHYGRGMYKTHREQGTGRSTAAIANDSDLLGVEQALGRGVNRLGGALSAQLLTKEIFPTVDNLPDGVLEPVVLLWEGGVIGRAQPSGTIQQAVVRVHPLSNGGGDSLRERLSACLRVETNQSFGGVLGSDDKAMEPLGDANTSAAIVGDVDNQLLGTCCFEGV